MVKGECSMHYKEVFGDLFDVRTDYVLAHCISEDCRMGAGIAVAFVNRNPHMRNELLKQVPKIGDAIFYKGEQHDVFNLITKKNYYDKPTRSDFNLAVASLKKEMVERGLKKLALPRIGAGLDKLNWEESSQFIQETFKDTDIQIFVVKQ